MLIKFIKEGMLPLFYREDSSVLGGKDLGLKIITLNPTKKGSAKVPSKLERIFSVLSRKDGLLTDRQNGDSTTQGEEGLCHTSSLHSRKI